MVDYAMKPEDLGNILIEMGRALTAKPYPCDSAEFAVRNVLLVAILAGAQACHAMTPPDNDGIVKPEQVG